MTKIVAVWEFGRDTEPEDAAAVAIDNARAPSAFGQIVDRQHDLVRLSLTRGTIDDPGGLLYVGQHGLFVVAANDPEDQFVLRAWPGT